MSSDRANGDCFIDPAAIIFIIELTMSDEDHISRPLKPLCHDMLFIFALTSQLICLQAKDVVKLSHFHIIYISGIVKCSIYHFLRIGLIARALLWILNPFRYVTNFLMGRFE